MTLLNRSIRAIARRKKTHRGLRTVHEKKKGNKSSEWSKIQFKADLCRLELCLAGIHSIYILCVGYY